MLLAVAALLVAACPAPAAERAIKAGDNVKVISGPAPVKLGKKTLTTVEAGTELKALKVLRNWVKVTVERDGKTVTGWIHTKRLELLARSEGASPGAEKPSTTGQKQEEPRTRTTQPSPKTKSEPKQETVARPSAALEVGGRKSAPVIITNLTFAKTPRGQEMRVEFAKETNFTRALKGKEYFGLAICYVPNAKRREVIKLLTWKDLYVPGHFQCRRKAGDSTWAVSWTGGAVANPSGGNGMFMLVSGYSNPKTGEAMSRAGKALFAKSLQASHAVTIPFDTWVDEKLKGAGRVAVCLAKGESGHFGSSKVISNIVESQVSFAEGN